MKTTNKLAVLLTLVVGTLAIGAGINQKHEVVILRGCELGHNPGTGYQYDGIFSYVSSSSKGAPTFPQYNVQTQVQTVQLAEAAAQLMDAGYDVTISADGFTVVAKK